MNAENNKISNSNTGFTPANTAKGNLTGFTLIELLVVISIIGFLITFAAFSLTNARMKSGDAKRIASIKQIQLALDLYYDRYNTWPIATADSCCNDWDQGYCNTDKSDGFINNLVSEGFMSEVPGDPKFYEGCDGFAYYLYDGGSYNCNSSKGKFYVLGIKSLETDTNPPTKFSGSGWSCPLRDWQAEFDYVVGKFEQN